MQIVKILTSQRTKEATRTLGSIMEKPVNITDPSGASAEDTGNVDMPTKFTPQWPEIVPIIIALGAGGLFAFVRAPWWLVIIIASVGYFSSRNIVVTLADKSQPPWTKTGALIGALVTVGLCAASEAPLFVIISCGLMGYFVSWYGMVIFSRKI